MLSFSHPWKVWGWAVDVEDCRPIVSVHLVRKELFENKHLKHPIDTCENVWVNNCIRSHIIYSPFSVARNSRTPEQKSIVHHRNNTTICRQSISHDFVLQNYKLLVKKVQCIKIMSTENSHKMSAGPLSHPMSFEQWKWTQECISPFEWLGNPWPSAASFLVHVGPK